MSDTDLPKQTRRQHITREEEADRCLNHTSYSKGSQMATVLLFLAVVFGVPIAQHVSEIRQNMAKQAAWSPSSGSPKPGLAPQVYDVFGLLPSREDIGKAKGFWGYWGLIPSMEKISAFETSLKENSVLTTSLLSPTQLVMSSLLGAGNEKAYVGRDGWLFYRPDVEYLTSGPFLDPTRLKERSHGSTEVQPDPVKAILDFKAQLYTRGIQLVVMPMCTKPMIHPEMLAGDAAKDLDLQNESFPKFKQELESNGVKVFDPTPTLRELKASSPSKLYLETDTHWTPDAMHATALKLGEFLERQCGVPATPQSSLAITPKEVSNLGDIAEMLKLPSDQKLYAKQKVTVQQVTGTGGSPWMADRNADVLLLGDSFSNIFSLEGMGWGTSAGFAEHLSVAIGWPIDKIVINAGGAYASRRDLAAQLARGVDRLANKRIVVYEFSMRDLAQGDWKMIHLPLVKKAAPTPPVETKKITPEVKPLTALGTLAANSGTLDLGTHQKVELSLEIVPGTLREEVLNAQGAVVRVLNEAVKSGGNVDGKATLKTHWDGMDDHRKPVAIGTYTVRVTGTRPDGSQLTPVTADVAVFDSTKKGATKPPAPPVQTKPLPGKNPTKPPAGPGTTAPPKPAAEEGLIVTGRIAARPATPKPGAVPYKDCLIALQLTDLKVTGGTVKGSNIVVYVWGMRDNKLTDGAFTVGQTLRFKLVPWASVDSKYGGFNRQELDSDEALSWEAFWGEVK